MTQSAANTFTPTSAASPAVIAVEVQQTDLDLNNGFSFVQVSIPITGTNAQLGAAFYIAYGIKYAQTLTPSALS